MKRHVVLGGGSGPIGGAFRPLVTLSVRAKQGHFVDVLFCIDTGADLTAMPIALAERKGIAVPRDSHSRKTAVGLVGTVDQQIGVLNVRISGEPFTWPCAFLESKGPASRFEYGVIGRIGFLASFDSCVKRPFCTITRRTDHLPWWRRSLAKLTPSQLHPFDAPL